MKICFDTEVTTYAKGNPYSRCNRFVCASVYFFDTGTIKTYWQEDTSELIEVLNAATEIVGFNLKFDLAWGRRVGATFDKLIRVWDCQLFEFFRSNQRWRFPDLDTTALRYLKEQKIDVIKTDYWDKGIDTDQIPREVLQPYAEKDVDLTTRIYELQKAQRHSWLTLYLLHCKDLLVLQEMEWNGLYLDVEECLKHAAEVKARISRIETELRVGYEYVPINFDSTDHLSAYLYGGTIVEEDRVAIGVFGPTAKKAGQTRYKVIQYKYDLKRLVVPNEDIKLKKEGLYSTSENVLRSLKADKQGKRIISLLIERSKLSQLYGTFLAKFPAIIKQMDWPDNTLHGNYNQCVVVTGRLSSDKPNLQNMPPELKQLLKSRRGKVVNIDAKALEWCVASVLSKDGIALEEISEGQDAHQNNLETFKLPSRLIAKKFLFRLIYGGTAFAYATDSEFSDVSTSTRFWERVIEKAYEKYKGLADWHTRLVQTVIEKGSLLMPTGRIYTYWPFKKPNGELKWPRTTILNYPVQGTGADIMALYRVLLFGECRRRGIDATFISTVHDSVVADMPDEEVNAYVQCAFDVARKIPEQLLKIFNFEYPIPFRVEIGVGTDYNNLTEVRE